METGSAELQKENSLYNASQYLLEECFIVPRGLSYPHNYDFKINLPEVGLITVRPIYPDDTKMFEDLFKSLTPHSVYMRFFSFLRVLPANLLERFIKIDYAKEIALAALMKVNGKERMVGDARVVHTLRDNCAEFSVMVSDPLQGKGIGALLLWHCLAIAETRGFENIFGIVKSENRNMLALGRKLGFKVEHLLGSTEYKLSKKIEKNEKSLSDSCR